MSWIESDDMRQKASIRQLRSFGAVVGSVFAAIALWPVVVRGEAPRFWAVYLAAALLVPALVLPKSLGVPYRVWMFAGHILGSVNSRLLMAVVFYAVFTPMALVLRILGKDPMKRKFEPDSESYRIPRQPRPGSHMKMQF